MQLKDHRPARLRRVHHRVRQRQSPRPLRAETTARDAKLQFSTCKWRRWREKIVLGKGPGAPGRVLLIHGAVLSRAPLSPSASLGFARPSGRSLVVLGITVPLGVPSWYCYAQYWA